MQAERQIRRNPRVVYRDLAPGQGGVLLHLDTGQYHGVNVLGAVIWQLIDGGATPARIAAKVQSQFEGSSPDLQGDIERFLASLRERDLIVGRGRRRMESLAPDPSFERTRARLRPTAGPSCSR